MASTYSPNGIEKMTTGEQSGTWGTTTNANFEMLEEMITGVSDYSVTNASTKTETLTDGSSASFRHKIVRATGTLSQNQTLTIAATDAQKELWLYNSTTGTAEMIIAQGSATTTVSIKKGTWGHLFVDGSSDATVLQNQNIPDDFFVYYGTDHDIKVGYDETTNNAFSIISDVEGAVLNIVWAADQHDDAGDAWQWKVANAGVMTLGSDLNSKNTFVDMVTFTPNATVANSTVAFAGKVTVAGTMIATGTIGGTLSTAAQTAITSLGTLTTLTVDNLTINGNTITANSGALNLTPASGSAIVLDGTINVDAGVVTGATSITSTAFVGALTGNASGTAATVTGAAQTAITSLGTLTTLTIDNLTINGNTITADSGALNLTPASGSAIVLDGTINVDAGVVTGATSITSTAFVGALTGNASGTAATVTGAAQTAITSLGTLTTLTVDNITINTNTITADSGALNLTPASGSAIVLDGTISIDAGVVTGATSITSTAFVGAIDGALGGGTPAAASVTTLAVSGAISGASFKDEDDMGGGSSSATAMSSQQSIKAYVDANVGSASTITVSANNSTNETVYPIFVDGATGSQGAETDTGLNYNPSTGVLTTTSVTGNLTGNVTGDTSGTAATVTGAAQSAITSLGTLTALTVDDVAVNGKVITMTGSSSDTAVFTAGTNGTLSIVTTDAAAAAANIQITADGTVDIDSAGVLTLDSGAAINIEPASGSAILLDGTISIDAGVVTGATSITSTAFVGAIDGAIGGSTPAAASVTTLAISGAMSGASFKDEDDMGGGSSSATAVSSQQSIKAYVDAGGGLGTGESPASMQAFTSSGTWTRPTDIKKVMVYCVGGGGGAGSPPAETGGAGGGGGGCAIELIDVSGTGSETVTIGAGGAGGTGGTANGASGGVSSFGSFCSASGGATSQSNGRGNGGAGGIGTGGLINFRGNGGGGGAYEKEGSAGGGSFFAGGAAGTQGTSEPGINAYEYGGGGSGGTDADNGGNGRAGIIMVMEYK